MTLSSRDTFTKLGEVFLNALKERNFDRIETLFSDDVAFRALTPSALREGTGPVEATGWLRKWMGGATEFEVIASSVEPVVDRLHVNYQIKLYENDGWYIVAQQVYCRIEDDRIATLDLVCSGFRPIPGP